jgi:S-(hydroxymethyl)glutathione dehydrogenase/alcohol dehydrogenase
MLVHEHALVKVDREMPMDRAALIGCAVITGYGAVVHTAKIEPGCTRGGVRLRGYRAVDHQRGADCRRRPHHRDRQGPVQADLARAFGATDIVDAGLTATWSSR